MSILIYPQALVLGQTQRQLMAASFKEPCIGVGRVDTVQCTIAQNGWMYPGDVEHSSLRLCTTMDQLGIPFLTLFAAQLGGPNRLVLRACWSVPSVPGVSPAGETWCTGDEAYARGWMDGSPYGFPPSAHAALLALSNPNGVVPRAMP